MRPRELRHDERNALQGVSRKLTNKDYVTYMIESLD
jgi:hypothetical protein